MRNKLLVVGDLGCLKAYKVDYDEFSTNPRVELIKTVHTDEADGRLSHKVTDEAGRFPGGERGYHGVRAYGERHNIDLELAKRAINYLVKNVNQIVKATDEDRGVYFAAIKEINHSIFEKLEPGVRARIEQNVAEDLTRINSRQLLSHFPESY
ncbi:MAG: hypothetical protein JWQ71_4926 [Pedosphaera sp.]|nr:hypothetical protein [Pedosphaera sp.]